MLNASELFSGSTTMMPSKSAIFPSKSKNFELVFSSTTAGSTEVETGEIDAEAVFVRMMFLPVSSSVGVSVTVTFDDGSQITQPIGTILPTGNSIATFRAEDHYGLMRIRYSVFGDTGIKEYNASLIATKRIVKVKVFRNSGNTAFGMKNVVVYAR